MRVNLKYVAAGLLAVGMVVPAMAQGSGAETYKSKCARCHGDDGASHTFEGRMTKAAVLTDPKVAAMPDADLIAVVKDGKKKMPAFKKKLTDDQIAAVVAYVRTLGQ